MFLDDCKLFCLEPNLSNFYLPRGNVDDKTLCSNDNGVCMDGQCIILNAELSTKPPPPNPGTTQGPTNQPTAQQTTEPVTTLPPATTPPQTTVPPTTTPAITTIPPTTTPFMGI